jgi:hypothetical protein
MINLRYEVSGHCAGKMSGSEQKFSWTKFMIARALKTALPYTTASFLSVQIIVVGCGSFFWR